MIEYYGWTNSDKRCVDRGDSDDNGMVIDDVVDIFVVGGKILYMRGDIPWQRLMCWGYGGERYRGCVTMGKGLW